MYFLQGEVSGAVRSYASVAQRGYAANVGQVGNLLPILNRAAESFREINNGPISNQPQDAILDAILAHKLRHVIG